MNYESKSARTPCSLVKLKGKRPGETESRKPGDWRSWKHSGRLIQARRWRGWGPPPAPGGPQESRLVSCREHLSGPAPPGPVPHPNCARREGSSGPTFPRRLLTQTRERVTVSPAAAGLCARASGDRREALPEAKAERWAFRVYPAPFGNREVQVPWVLAAGLGAPALAAPTQTHPPLGSSHCKITTCPASP